MRVCVVILTLLCLCHNLGAGINIVLDPAGHAGDLGRPLVDGYERAQTYLFAEAIKKEIEARNRLFLPANRYKPFISRTPGEEILRLQIPSFSNRLGAQFFLRIHLYLEDQEKPKLFFYHLMFDPMVDLAKRNIDVLDLTPLYQSHFLNIHRTRACGKKICDYLNQRSFKKHFDCYSLRGMPLCSLIGVSAPLALLVEVGIRSEDQWKSLVDPIVESLFLVKDELI